MRINEIQEGSDREYLSLSPEDIERLREKFLPDWEYKDNSLQKRFKFEDYLWPTDNKARRFGSLTNQFRR